jgi:DNA invertase Pin-like site-specific DNA recombinase
MAPLKKKRSGGRGGHAKITDEQVKQVLNMFDSELIGCKAIAEKVGISKSSCQRILTQYGRKRTEEERLILSREGGAKGAGNRTDGNTTRAMIKKLYEERTATGRPMYTPAEIAEMVGVSRSYVYEIHCQQKRGES